MALPADNNVSLPIFETVRNDIKILGSIVGTRKDECFEEVEKGSVKARIVFDLR